VIVSSAKIDASPAIMLVKIATIFKDPGRFFKERCTRDVSGGAGNEGDGGGGVGDGGGGVGDMGGGVGEMGGGVGATEERIAQPREG
jgi:hypothetical protein